MAFSIAQVRHGEFHDELWCNQLDRLALLNVKSGTKYFVAIHDLLNARPNRILMKISLQAQADCQVKGQVPRFELIKEPETLLRKR